MTQDWQPSSRFMTNPEADAFSDRDYSKADLVLAGIPAPTPKRYVIVLEETGEVRFPRAGEWFLGEFGADVATEDFQYCKLPILRVVSREAL